MNGQENSAELVVICLVMIVLSIFGIAGSFSRVFFGGIDGLLILFISLMMVLIFSILLVLQAKQKGWIGKHHQDASPASSPAAAGK